MDDETVPERAEIMKRTFKFLVVGAALIALGGCASRRLATQGNNRFVPPPPPVNLPPGTVVVPPGGSFPVQYPPGQFPQATFPPGSVPAAGPAQGFLPTPPNAPVSPGPNGLAPFPTAPAPGPSSQFPTAPPPVQPNMPPAASVPGEAPDRVGYRWQPLAPPPSTSPPAPPLVAPAPRASAAPPTVLLLPPVPEPGTQEPPRQEPPRQEPQRQLYPPQQEKESLPLGIASFDRPRNGVASGQAPTLEGLDWLQKGNYKTVVFLHRPGESTDADRLQFERRGMTFVAIEINPRELSRDSVERFLQVQRKQIEERDKIFVYDLDRSLAGAMWYLSFRLIDQQDDEVALINARSIGLSETRESAREVWQAVRKYLESK
jgi:hypothetical protein